MNTDKKINLVLGISSAGKSTFIEENKETLFKNSPVYLANEIHDDNYELILSQNCVIHYNLFRPYNNSVSNINTPIRTDAVINYLANYSNKIEAYFLIEPLPIIAKRILLRDIAEPQLRNQTETNYPRIDIFELLHSIDYLKFHMDWLDFLFELNISLKVVSNNSFVDIKNLKNILLDDNTPSYTQEQIDKITSSNKFEYQQILLPSNQTTKGKDRSETFNIIKSNLDFKGKSVIDIGCAYGYFCFQAEQAGASKILGTELKKHRFIGSNILKHIFSSKCHFTTTDIFSKKEKEKFDIVLLLNVIHHLPEPIKSLRQAAELCREYLVIEFPTLNDNKFNKTLPKNYSKQINTDIPLIGVSLLDEQDQTFVFNQAAIRRILINNNKLFSNITFINSPISDQRLIAICKK